MYQALPSAVVGFDGALAAGGHADLDHVLPLAIQDPTPPRSGDLLWPEDTTGAPRRLPRGPTARRVLSPAGLCLIVSGFVMDDR